MIPQCTSSIACLLLLLAGCASAVAPAPAPGAAPMSSTPAPSLGQSIRIAIALAPDLTPRDLQSDADEQCGGGAHFIEVNAQRMAIFACGGDH